ncbi:angiopoietin-related protein 4 isoform X2 [Drosophila ananassae]|uniref:angiopoietin-related protein 4 isoform X2 n=1 Tax=Drosophila ananassae TaxID=7217 RepID=UPI001CFFB2BE|nr:angiopoietin-related protein 4 isoform X2 [Drosophila ananassae]
MMLLVVFVSAIYLISPSLGSEDEDECAAVCYPMVKPMLRYFEKCQEKDSQTSQCQKDYSELLKRHTEVLQQLNEVNVKYEKLQSKLEILSELGVFENQFREDIAKLREVLKKGEMSKSQVAIKNTNEIMLLESEISIINQKKSETPTISESTEPTSSENKTLNVPALPDRCPQSQKPGRILQEIHVPGSDPFKVVCYTDRESGSGWIVVYQKYYHSSPFNRSYEEYAAGFGDRSNLREDFFLGLEKLHLLTDGRPHELMAAPFKGKCNRFVLGSRDEGYMVKSTGKCSGNMEVGFVQSTKFSTFDRDEDGDPGRNWAERRGVGWWFDSRNNAFFENRIIRILIRRQDSNNALYDIGRRHIYKK